MVLEALGFRVVRLSVSAFFCTNMRPCPVGGILACRRLLNLQLLYCLISLNNYQC